MPKAHKQRSHGPGRCFEKGKKQNPSNCPWQAPEDGLGGAVGAPGAGPAPRCPAHPAPPAAAPGGCWFWKASAFTQPRALALCTLLLCARRLGSAVAPSSPRCSRGLKTLHPPPPPPPAPTRQAPSSLQLRALLRFLHKKKHQGHSAGCSTRQPAPGVPGGAGGAGPGGSPQLFSKQPRWCHCWSRTRRMDWIRGWLASHSFQCRYSPFSKTCWRPRYPGYS